MAADIVQAIALDEEDIELALTVYFNGGPISVSVSNGRETKTHSFDADPFFRARSHYIATGAILFRIPSPLPVDTPFVIVAAQFANMFDTSLQPANGVHFQLQLSSPRRNMVIASHGAAVAVGDFQNVVLLFVR